MADTIRKQLLAAVKTRFEAILVPGGYNFDLGSNVFEWRDPALENSDLPALVYQDVTRSIQEGQTANYRINFLAIECGIFAQQGATTSTDLRQMIGDVYKAIGVDATWGSIATRTQAVSNGISIEQEKKINGMATIRFNIVYAAQKFESYTNL